MKQAQKKRPPHATANSPPGLPDMVKLLYKSKKFVNNYIFLKILNNFTFINKIDIYIAFLRECQYIGIYIRKFILQFL